MGKEQLHGDIPGPLLCRGNNSGGEKLFGRWQQRCGLTLSLLQQVAAVAAAAVVLLLGS